MKNITILNICLFFLIFSNACNTKRLINEKEEKEESVVTKIDSINNFYIIYASKNNSKFKIISPKNTKKKIKNCVEIAIENSYNFILKSGLEARKESPPIIGGIKLEPANYLDIHCYSYDDDTFICIEPEKGIYDLYSCENLVGLCFIKSKKAKDNLIKKNNE
jgi:hypothetical protein